MQGYSPDEFLALPEDFLLALSRTVEVPPSPKLEGKCEPRNCPSSVFFLAPDATRLFSFKVRLLLSRSADLGQTLKGSWTRRDDVIPRRKSFMEGKVRI